MTFERREELFEHYCDLYRNLPEEEFTRKIEAKPVVERELDSLYTAINALEQAGVKINIDLLSRQALHAVMHDALSTVAREKENGRTGYMGGPPATTTSRSPEADIEAESVKVWEDFWRPLVTTDGVLDEEKVKGELHDFYVLMDNASRVYDSYTGGLISKPMTSDFEVIGEGNRHQEQSIAEDIRDEISQEIQDKEPDYKDAYIEGLKRAKEIVEERMG